MQIPFIGDGVASRFLKRSPEKLINLYPVIHEGNIFSASLMGTPGFRIFADINNARIRMIHVMDGVLYCLAGERFYRVDSDGSSFQKGVIPGTTRPRAADNGTQLVMPVGDGYIYNKTLDSVAQITDPDYEQSTSCCFVGQYISFVKENSGEFLLSAFQDASDIDALDFATSEAAPDDLIANQRFKGTQWLIGTDSTEVWYVTAESFPMNPVPGHYWDVGCIAKYSVDSNENYIAWLGNDRQIYASTGGQPQVISDEDMAYQLSKLSVVDNAEGFLYTMEGHTFYQITFQTDKKTFVYDFQTQRWHERQSGQTRHRASMYAYVYGKHIIADYQTGKLYEWSLDFGDEDTARITRECITPGVHNNGEVIRFPRIELMAETGVTPLNDDEDVVQVRWSDTGADWGEWVNMPYGARGERFTRLKLHGCGSSKERYHHLRTTTKGQVNWLSLVKT
ncbi:MAG: hypothetical protein ACPGSM_18640 [Thiolinea sp.]